MGVGSIIGLIIVGAIIGALARLVVPGRNPIGILATVLIGIVAAIIGGYIGAAIGVGLWLSWVIGIVLAAIGVALLSGYSRGGTRARRSV